MPVTYIPVSIPDASTYTVKASNSGLYHYLPDLGQDCTITLPTPAAGLHFTFSSAGAAADASNWIITSGSDTNYFLGGFVHNNTTADEEAGVIDGDGNSNSKVTIVTPAAGTCIRFECTNGTLWVLSGHVTSATIPVFADQ